MPAWLATSDEHPPQQQLRQEAGDDNMDTCKDDGAVTPNLGSAAAGMVLHDIVAMTEEERRVRPRLAFRARRTAGRPAMCAPEPRPGPTP